jgi:16S rRNA (cytosine967-C5)-methyltransferase
VLDLGAGLTKPGGTLAYVTCSVLPEENRDQVAAFLKRHADFSVEPFTTAWSARVGGEPPRSADGAEDTLQLTPARHATDGFFIALLRRHQP